MDCETCRRLISLDMDGELSPDRKEALTRHLEGCAECSVFRADLERLRAFFAAEEGAPSALSPAAAERIRRAAAPILAERRRSRVRLVFLKAAAAAVFVLAVTAGLFAVHTDTVQAVDPSKEIHYEDLFRNAREGDEGVLVEILLKTDGPREAFRLFSAWRRAE